MNTITEAPRALEVKGSYDVAVCGGGIAGVAAALAAVRAGAKALLIEKQFILGGLATAGIVTIYLPLCDGMGRQVSFGIAEELLRESIRYGCEAEYPAAWLDGGTPEERTASRFRLRYNPNVCAVAFEQLLVGEGCGLLYGTSVCGVAEDNGKITHLIVENKSGRSAYAVKSVVDCTGDADVCALSSAPTANFTEGNVLAGWYYFLDESGLHLKMVGAADVVEGKVSVIGGGRFLGIDGEELSRVTVRSHAATLDSFLKGGGITPTHSLTMLATTPQVRMTRRVAGEYTLDLAEEHKEFEDSVGLFANWRKRGPVYELPFRALYSRAVRNLITAGRCFSVTDKMWDISRVIPVCAVSGEAAGLAAAMTDDFPSLDVKTLQSALEAGGVKLHEARL